MAGAYACIANDGVYIEPVFYTKITTLTNETLIEKSQTQKKVFSTSVSFIVKELLKEPVEGNHGTAQNCYIPEIDVAAKTGTTDENYDRWLCGFTNYYTCVAWYGYDYNENINYPSVENPASVLWSNVMKKIHENLNPSSFKKPTNALSATVCSKTRKTCKFLLL